MEGGESGGWEAEAGAEEAEEEGAEGVGRGGVRERISSLEIWRSY